MFVKYLGQKIILEFSLGHFQICMNRAIKNVQKFYSRLIGGREINKKFSEFFFGTPFSFVS